MAGLARMWILSARVRRRLARRAAPREELVRQHAPGRSFADIGCMWNVDGAIAFLAEESGATQVTGLDVMPATTAFDTEHTRRHSSVRFVHGDVHDPAAIAEVGVHDLVWCWGVLYHSPNPFMTLERLRMITSETLILASETIPEVPGVHQACVFYPGLGEADRHAHMSARPGMTALGLSGPFDSTQRYGAWWWGISRSALHGMLSAASFEVTQEWGDDLHAVVLATPVPN